MIARISPSTTGNAARRRSAVLNTSLWAVQIVLALLFLFAGGMKLVLPIEAMTKEMPMPGWFLRFIGVAEALGALGLILPGLARLSTVLTPLAAAGLAILMTGATVLTLSGGGGAAALFPLAVGLLAAFVAYGRWRPAPHRARYHRPSWVRPPAR
jgi:uncharacterized membrane protein YphA (DoxX/SURF4 family)